MLWLVRMVVEANRNCPQGSKFKMNLDSLYASQAREARFRPPRLRGPGAGSNGRFVWQSHVLKGWSSCSFMKLNSVKNEILEEHEIFVRDGEMECFLVSLGLRKKCEFMVGWRRLVRENSRAVRKKS